jgi:hypothetical protein
VQAAIFNILSFNAPSELVSFVIQFQGNIFKSFPDNDAKNVSTRNHLQIAWKASPIPIRLYVNEKEFFEGSNG